jgi:hypothetical protein
MHFKERTRNYWSWLFAGLKPRTKSAHDENSARVNAALDAVVAALNAAAEERRPDQRL